MMAWHKGPHILWVHLYEISRIGKSIETESRLVVSRSWGWGDGEWLLTEWVWGLLWGSWKCSRTRQRWWLHNIVNALNATESCTLKWLHFLLFVFYHKKFTGLDLALSSLLWVSDSQTALSQHTHRGWSSVPASTPRQAGGTALMCTHSRQTPCKVLGPCTHLMPAGGSGGSVGLACPWPEPM